MVLFPLLLALAASGQVWTVDDDGPADFVEITDAIASPLVLAFRHHAGWDRARSLAPQRRRCPCSFRGGPTQSEKAYCPPRSSVLVG